MRPSARGFTLVELMISLVLGLLVIAGLYSAYLATSEMNRQRAALERASTSGLFTTELLADQVRMAVGTRVTGDGDCGDFTLTSLGERGNINGDNQCW